MTEAVSRPQLIASGDESSSDTVLSVVIAHPGGDADASRTITSLSALQHEFPRAELEAVLIGTGAEVARTEAVAVGFRTHAVGEQSTLAERLEIGRRMAKGDHQVSLTAGQTVEERHTMLLAAKAGIIPTSLSRTGSGSIPLGTRLAALGLTLGGALELDSGTVFEGPVSLPCGISNLGPAHIGAFTYSSSPITHSVASVGRYCSIADGVQFGAAEHPTGYLSTSPFQYNGGHMWSDHLARTGATYCNGDWTMRDNHAPVIIGNDVWIGAGAYIRGGVTIGDGAIIGTRAVVTRDVPPYAIVVGNPGRVVRRRFRDQLVDDLLALEWWRFDCADFEGIDVREPEAAVEVLQERERSGSIRPYRGFQTPLLQLINTF